MNQEENKAKWNHNLNGYNPSGLTPNKTLLEHIQDIEAKIIELEKKTGTPIFIKDLLQNRIDFTSSPQTQLDNHAKSISENVKGIAHLNEFVEDNTGNIALLGADKQNFAIEKHKGNLNVGTMQEFRDYFYELRKSPTRTYQYEVSGSTNIDLMDILSWPNGNGKSVFIYVNLPYSEAGGFEIDITYMERNGDNIYKRTMTSTLNANWKDSGWVQYAKQSDLTTLASKVENNTTKLNKLYTVSDNYNIRIDFLDNHLYLFIPSDICYVVNENVGYPEIKKNDLNCILRKNGNTYINGLKIDVPTKIYLFSGGKKTYNMVYSQEV